ncbi:hypothetical protein [Pyrococcus kukulkanii]|uniref:hypothetical protein n=1 Tax=Pyrococcus kukulkanii TaxID=1609559 RepID=UPI0035665484
MRVSIRVSLPLIFPGLLMVSTLQIIVAVSGREEGIAAGALFAMISLPFLFIGYLFAKEKEDLMFVHAVLPVLGFYPFAYATKSPSSWILVGLVLLIPALSVRNLKMQKGNVDATILALSVIVCLGLPTKTLSAVGLASLLLMHYVVKRNVKLKTKALFLISYVILWGLINWKRADPVIMGMGIVFGVSMFLLMHLTEKRLGENGWERY